jgi:hypothetical protein
MADQQIIAPGRPTAPSTNFLMTPRLPERGHIKIGGKGAVRQAQNSDREYQLPEKYDYFVVTTMDRNPPPPKGDGNFVRDDEIMKLLGEKPTEIPVRLLYDDPAINFITSLAAYKGRTLWCRGNGREASRVDPADAKKRIVVGCPCERNDPAYAGPEPKCKWNGMLQCIIDLPGINGVNGVWKFRTTSYNSCNDIWGSLLHLQHLTYGILAGVPLKLVLRAKHVTSPVDGKPQTVYTVSVEVREGGIPELTAAVHQVGLLRARGRVQMEAIEDQARRMLALPAPESGRALPGDEEANEISAEFQPDPEDVADAARQEEKAAAIAEGRTFEGIGTTPAGDKVDGATGEVIEEAGKPTQQQAAAEQPPPPAATPKQSKDAKAAIDKFWARPDLRVTTVDKYAYWISTAPTADKLAEFVNANQSIVQHAIENDRPAAERMAEARNKRFAELNPKESK